LRPFSPKKVTVNGKTSIPMHLMSVGPFCLISNAILRAAGYPDFTRRLCPTYSTGSVHALPLSPVGLFECLCAEGRNHYDIYRTDGSLISSTNAVNTIPGDDATVLGAFFDLDKLRDLCKRHGLVFDDRYILLSRLTLYMLKWLPFIL
jgi:hypothetical protein